MKEATTFIQWKGTDLCMDFYCTCGENSHFDGYYAYAVKCMKCGQVYSMPTNINPIPVEKLIGNDKDTYEKYHKGMVAELIMDEE